jgi:hypothetical protein
MVRQENRHGDMNQQAVHDRSVIDHLVETFHRPPMAANQSKRTMPASPSLYHQLRRQWTARNGGLAEF